MTLSRDRLRLLLDYDASTGEFRWRLMLGTARAGRIAGYIDKEGYRRIGIDGAEYPAHRLAFFYEAGDWPEHDIDHINGDRADNRRANLRVASRSENLQNQRKAHADSRSGLLGASWNKNAGRWMAQISVSGKRRYLGLFDSAAEAHEAYVSAKRQLHSGCTI